MARVGARNILDNFPELDMPGILEPQCPKQMADEGAVFWLVGRGNPLRRKGSMSKGHFGLGLTVFSNVK